MATGGRTPLDNPLPMGEVYITKADGLTHYYKATADTDAARGQVLKDVETAHVDGDRINVSNGSFLLPTKMTLKKGVHLALAQGTTIKLADQGGTTYSGSVIATSIALNNIGTKITGGTIDCNLQGQSAASAVIGGVSLWGGATCDGVTFINWGSKWAGQECFIVFIGAIPSIGPVYAAKALNNIVHTPAPIVHLGGTSAICILGFNQTGAGLITPGDGWMFSPEIAGNVVINVTTGTGTGQPAPYFHAYGVSSSYGARIHDNQAINLNVTGVQDNSAIYFDQWSNKHLTIQNNTFTDVGWGIQNVTPLATLYEQDDWAITGNHISSILGGVGLTPTNGAMTRVVLRGNTFTTTTSPHNASFPYGFGYSVKNINGLTVEGNTNDTLRGYQVQSGVTNYLLRNNKTSSNITPVDSSVPGVPEEGWADEVVTFVPPTTGWYRIAIGSNGIGGDITIANIQSGHLTETVFHYEVAGYGLGSSLTQTRSNTFNPAITQARVSSDAGACYLDINVATTDTTSPLIIYSRGSAKMRGKLVAVPVVGAIVGASSPNVLTFIAGLATTGNLVVGNGTTITKILSASASLNFPSMLTATEATLTITITGVVTTNSPSVALGWSSALPDGIEVKQAWISAADTVSIRVRNSSAGTIDPAAVTCRATVTQF